MIVDRYLFHTEVYVHDLVSAERRRAGRGGAAAGWPRWRCGGLAARGAVS
jgi:hypothetical protein